jgi:hypothetical protein
MAKESDFMNSFNLMRASFRHPIVQEETIAYLEYLSNLPYISAVMAKASKGDFDFDPRFIPTVAQLIEAHDNYEEEVEEKARQERADKFGLPVGGITDEQREKNRQANKKFREIMSICKKEAGLSNPFVLMAQKYKEMDGRDE